ncbi:MAG: GNAT family N-acetyltransferase [Chitinophagaceae bacterium]|nr:GNAT family N-acetyltransferase [Chitinophagaceae bacterium]
MQNKALGYLSFAFISLVWGTTYLVTRIGVMHFPAILFTGIRNASAGLLLLLVLLLFRIKYQWTWENIYPQLVSGFFILALGNGMVSWSLHYIPSGLSALLCTLVPINMIVISLVTEKSRKASWHIFVGLVFAITGMGFIFRDNIADIARPEYLLGIVSTIAATISWSLGSVYSKSKSNTGSPLYKAAIQLLTGGLVLLVVSPFSEDWSHLPVPDTATILALLYLVVIGSSLAFAAYQYALSTLPAGVVSVYAYINPLVALLLGYSLLGERLTWFTFTAFIFTAAGIFFINEGYKRQKKKEKQLPSSPEQDDIRIRDYEPSLQPYFEKFNKAWLEEYFTVEPIDKFVLENPQEAILKDGGKILFVEYKGTIIGTVALRKVGDDSYELTKMAVDRAYRGLGAGKLLCQAAINEARLLNARSVILYSQTALPVALGIYRKMGFVDIPLEQGKYKRADVKMEMKLNYSSTSASDCDKSFSDHTPRKLCFFHRR